MSMTVTEMKPKPSGLWYLLVVALWIGSAIAFIALLLPVIKIFSDGITYVENGATIAVPEKGITVYTTVDDPTRTCQVTGSSGNAITLTPFDSGSGQTFSFDPGNGTVYALASTPKNFPSGTYDLTCDTRPHTQIAWGNRVDFTELGSRLLVSIGISGLLGLIGLILLIVLLVKRHNSKQRIRIAQSSAQYQYGYAYGAAQPYQQDQAYGQPPASAYPPPASYPPPESYPPPDSYPQPGSYPPPTPYGSPDAPAPTEPGPSADDGKDGPGDQGYGGRYGDRPQ